MEENPQLMFGAGFVCSNFVVSELCKDTKFYQTESNINLVYMVLNTVCAGVIYEKHTQDQTLELP